MVGLKKLILKFFKKTKRSSAFKGFVVPEGKIKPNKQKVNLSKVEIIPELQEEINYIFNELGKLGGK